MVWLNRSPIPVGRRGGGAIFSFKWFLPVFATYRGRGKGVITLLVLNLSDQGCIKKFIMFATHVRIIMWNIFFLLKKRTNYGKNHQMSVKMFLDTFYWKQFTNFNSTVGTYGANRIFFMFPITFRQIIMIPIIYLPFPNMLLVNPLLPS